MIKLVFHKEKLNTSDTAYGKHISLFSTRVQQRFLRIKAYLSLKINNANG